MSDKHQCIESSGELAHYWIVVMNWYESVYIYIYILFQSMLLFCTSKLPDISIIVFNFNIRR